MIHIASKPFLMGSTDKQIEIAINDGMNPDWAETEKPRRMEYAPEYFIGRFPITNREYQYFVEDENYNPPSHWDNIQYPLDKGDHPVVNVSWYDANNYCNWLSTKTGKDFKLPSEAQWERAARGTSGKIWPWGNEFDSSRANTRESDIGTTTPVGQFSPQGDSGYGCADMIGNVWEWCSDKWEYDPKSKMASTSHVSEQGENYIVRGGSYNRYKWDARCATRRANRPDLVGSAKGFRVALSSTDKIEN